VAIFGSGDCPAKHRVSLNLKIGTERLVHTGTKTQSPWHRSPGQCAQGDGERWRLRASIRHTNRFVLPLWPETPRIRGGSDVVSARWSGIWNPPTMSDKLVAATENKPSNARADQYMLRCSCPLQPAPLFNVLITDYCKAINARLAG
jgi:hypothetical protein